MGSTDPDRLDDHFTVAAGRFDQPDQLVPTPAVRGAHSRDLMTGLLAVAADLPRVRGLVWDWLTEQVWPIPAAEDIQLAVNEAVSNVIDHAYPPATPGPVTVHAWVSVDLHTNNRRVVVAVTDRGRWATHHPDTHPLHTRGHGLLVMSGCMAEVHIQRADAGTTVILISDIAQAVGRWP